ncbi:MAG: beta-galactosidase, partial [Anaerolineae bacterium]|nr:beta-galactosidase [Anaerolineae bacterium]
MVSVQIHDKQVWLGDKAYPLLSGEVHYWRLQPENWRAVLRQVRALGLDMAATYVCWEYHEIAPGDYDLTGRTAPARNLPAFLDMAADEGLKLILRPGPYIYSEWVNAGIPDRVVGVHRLHPDFKAAALPYMAAVVEVARPYLATNGGPIVLWQAENEPDPWPYYYEDQLGFGDSPGLFHEFLEKRYGDVSRLNAAWEIDFSAFTQAQVVMRPAFRDRAYLNRYLDFCRFRAWYAAECVRWTAGEFRRLGVDVPILANTYVTPQIGGWRDFEAGGAADVAGPDLYPSNEFRAGPDEHRDFLDTVRRTRTYSALPVIPEFEAGIWQGGQKETGVLSANHYLLACLSALLAGVAGWNWYMLVNRDNWLCSPINEWGRTRPELYDAFARIVRAFREINPPTLEKLTSVGVIVNVRDPLPTPHGDAALRALYDADIDIEIDDLETDQAAKPLLVYAGGDWLSREAQAR